MSLHRIFREVALRLHTNISRSHWNVNFGSLYTDYLSEEGFVAYNKTYNYRQHLAMDI